MQSISTAKTCMRRLVAIVLLNIAAECLLTPNAYAEECFALESKQDVETKGSAENFFRDWAESLEPLVHLRTKFPVELGEISDAELGEVRNDLRGFVYGEHLFREISMPSLVRSLVFARRAMVQNNEKTLRQVFQQTRAVPYFGHFLYGLTFSYENSNAIRRMILAEHHDFVGARQSFRNQHSKEAWANAQQEFLSSLLSTAQQIQTEISKPKANFLELEEIADIAVRMDVGTWAKRMEPSRLYSGF